MASAVVNALDGVLTRLAGLADNPVIDYQYIVIMSGWIQSIFELQLDGRQLKCFELTAPPVELKEHLSDETFKKAQSYGKDKIRYSMAKAIFNTFLSFALLKYRIYAQLWDATGGFMESVGLAQNRTTTHSLLWMAALTALSSIPSLPWGYYYTFVLEEKHGFNKSTVKLWVTDQIKTWALLAVLGLPILAGFLKVIEWAGKNFVPWLMLFMITIQLSLQIIYPTFIQPLFNKLTPLPAGDLRERVERLAGKLGFPLKHLYIIDGSKRSSHSNAYFYGLPWSKHIVIYDTLMEKSTAPEVEAVLGHELGHWYYNHPSKLLLVAQANLLFTFTLFSVFIHNRALFSSFGFDPRLATSGPAGGPQPIVIGFMLYQLVFEPMDTVVKFLMNSQTRKYEYQADEFAVKLDKKDELKSALTKLHIDNLSSPHSDWMYSMYHHSHPTLPERLRAMEKFAQTKEAKAGLGLKENKEL